MTTSRPTTPEQALDQLADLDLALGTREILDELADLRDLLAREATAASLTVPARPRKETR